MDSFRCVSVQFRRVLDKNPPFNHSALTSRMTRVIEDVMTQFAPTYSHCCPECETTIDLVAVPEWLLTEFKGIMARVLAVLLKGRREHKLVTMREMCAAAWPGRWADVPDNAATVVLATIWRYRGRLNYLGWDIANPYRTGKEGYFLVAITPKGEFDKPIGSYRMSHLVTKKRKKRKRKKE